MKSSKSGSSVKSAAASVIQAVKSQISAAGAAARQLVKTRSGRGSLDDVQNTTDGPTFERVKQVFEDIAAKVYCIIPEQHKHMS